MSNIPEILIIIDGEYDSWIPLKQVIDNAKVADSVETISCDTRDFAIGWDFKRPEPFKRADCGLEIRTNEGLARMRRLKDSPALSDYLIEATKIVPWLKQVCEKSGGFDEDWRYLTAKVDGCTNWDIKYIRFVRHDTEHFMVCNAYWYPVKWNKILDNMDIRD